jgi:MarR family transcriptional regulator, negative regulator of the multidrug operon emrRAB
MFLLQDIPTLNTLMLLRDRYRSFSPSAMRSCLMLLRTGSDLLILADKLFRKVGLSQGGFLTLVVLNRNPKAELTPSELSEKIGVTRATMTGLLDTLAKDGHIQRLQHKGDRRKLVVRLTEAGRNRLDTLLPKYMGELALLTSNLSEKEQQTLIGLLEKVNRGPQATKKRKTLARSK